MFFYSFSFFFMFRFSLLPVFFDANETMKHWQPEFAICVYHSASFGTRSGEYCMNFPISPTTIRRRRKDGKKSCVQLCIMDVGRKETFRISGSRGSWENAVWTLKLHFVQIRKATSSASVVIISKDEEDVLVLELFHPACFLFLKRNCWNILK